MYSIYCILCTVCIVIYALCYMHCCICIVVYALCYMHYIICTLFYVLHAVPCIMDIIFTYFETGCWRIVIYKAAITAFKKNKENLMDYKNIKTFVKLLLVLLKRSIKDDISLGYLGVNFKHVILNLFSSNLNFS